MKRLDGRKGEWVTWTLSSHVLPLMLTPCWLSSSLSAEVATQLDAPPFSRCHFRAKLTHLSSLCCLQAEAEATIGRLPRCLATRAPDMVSESSWHSTQSARSSPAHSKLTGRHCVYSGLHDREQTSLLIELIPRHCS